MSAKKAVETLSLPRRKHRNTSWIHSTRIIEAKEAIRLCLMTTGTPGWRTSFRIKALGGSRVETKLRRCCLSLREADLVLSLSTESSSSELCDQKCKGFAFCWAWQDTARFPLLEPGHSVAMGFAECSGGRGRDQCAHTAPSPITQFSFPQTTGLINNWCQIPITGIIELLIF